MSTAAASSVVGQAISTIRAPDATELGPNRDTSASTRGLDAVLALRDRAGPSLENGGKTSALHALRCPLDYLLGEEDSMRQRKEGPNPDGSHRVNATLLGAARSTQGGLDRGIVVVEPARFGGCFLDPVQMGLRLFDQRFLRSVHLGGRCCRAELDKQQQQHPTRAARALRVGIEPGQPGIVSFSGGSAGGLLAWGMYAAVLGETLDTDASASVVLGVRDGIDPDEDASLKADDVLLLPVGRWSLNAKLEAAARGERSLSQPRLNRIALSPTQDYHHQSWPTWVDGAERSHQLKIRPATTFAEGYRQLTGDARRERWLEFCCRQCVRDWDPRLLKEPWPAPDQIPEPARPRPFVEPHYAELFAEDVPTDTEEDRFFARVAAEKLDRTTKYKPFLPDDVRKAVTRETARRVAVRELAQLMKVGKRICLAEDANSGKTIFSHRLRWFLASKAGRKAVFGGKPGLVVRFENRLGSQDWPKTGEELMRRLAEAVREAARSDNRHVPEVNDAKAVVEYALNAGRVALILDAVDQAGNPTELLKYLNADPRWWKCPVIITGRSFAFRAENDSLFPRDLYKFVTILPFDENQQARLLAGVCDPGQDFRTLFDSYDSVQELLAVPGMIAMVHGIAAEERKRPCRPVPLRLTQLVTRADFYWRFYRKMMLRAARKHPEVQVDRHEPRWQMMLAVTAFRMVLERATRYTVAGSVRDQVRADVAAYCRKFDGTELTDDDWTRLQNFSALSDHDVLEGRDDGVLSWRHKGWMEFFYGLFLARYFKADCLAAFDWDLIRPEVPAEDRDEPGFLSLDPTELPAPVAGQSADDVLARAVMTQIVNDPQWEWGWEFATDIPRITPDAGDKAPFHPRHLGSSLGHLYRRPARGLRPTRLIYLALPFFEGEHDRLRDFGWKDSRTGEFLEGDALKAEWARRGMRLPGADAVLAEFRREFQEWKEPPPGQELGPAEWTRRGFTRSPHAIARELVADVSTTFPLQADYEPKKHGFVMCPPAGWKYPDNPNADPCVYQRAGRRTECVTG